MQQVWRGKGVDGAMELQRRLHVLFHLVNFALKRRILYEPVSVWPPLPSNVVPILTVYPKAAKEYFGNVAFPNIFSTLSRIFQFFSILWQRLEHHDESSDVEEDGESASSSNAIPTSNHLRVWQPTMTRKQTSALSHKRPNHFQGRKRFPHCWSF